MGKLATVYRKEMKEVLRDKRTIIVLILLPMVVMPLMYDAMISFIISRGKQAQSETLQLALVNPDAMPELAKMFEDHEKFEVVVDITDPAKVVDAIREDKVDMGLTFPSDAGDLLASNRQVEIRFQYNNADAMSRISTRRIETVLENYNRDLQTERMRALGVGIQEREALLEPTNLRKEGVADRRESLGENIGGILPYLFIAFCFVGALYPAIDIGAGEKERGTLETLLLTPVPRSTLVLAKFGVTFTSGLAAGILCVCSIAIFIMWRGASYTGDMGDIIQSISPLDLAMIGFMLIPLAAIFAALMLSISIYAKNFKEAQSYISPLSFVGMLPAIVAILPGIELTWKTALIPVSNISLAIKELVKGTVDYSMVGVIFLSTAVLAGVCIAFCISWFQKESVLFRN